VDTTLQIADRTYQITFIYVILPLVGIALIVFALIWGRRLGKRPFEIGLAKLGINLKADTMTLLILLGFLMACVGVFFQYRGYETKVTDLKGLLNEAQTKIEERDKILKSFQVYSMRFHLLFPETDTIDAPKIEVQAYIEEPGQVGRQLRPCEKCDVVSNDVWVNVDDLRSGDKLRIVAYEGDEKSWMSNDVEIPKTRLQMRREE